MFFTFSPTAVVVGFISSFVGGLVGMLMLGGLGMALIIPGMVPHFFCGGTSGVFADKLGGKRGCIIAAFIGGIFRPSCRRCCCRRSATSGLKTAPSPISTSRCGASLSVTRLPSLAVTIYLICLALLVALLAPFCFRQVRVVGNTLSYEELIAKQKNE